jgi:hypothetical protein
MIRTLLTKGEAEYKVVGKDPDTGEFDVQVIRKEGPTTLFTTTVSRVKGEQLDSRLYALDIPDDPAQQRAALHAQAKMELDGDIPEAGPAFLALQEWLQLQAPIMVVVPYVGPLFKLLGQSRTDPRLLRDSKRLLTLIKCSAILHLAHRERDAKGRLVAGLQDYQTIADLIVDMYEVTVTGVTPGMRRVVEAVAQAGKPISQTDVADCLKISTSTVGKHVKRALTGGWLVNDEYRPGHPDRLKVGEELPHPCGLPSVAQLRTQGAGSGAIGLTPSHFPPRNQEVRTVSPHQAETAETPGGLTVLTNPTSTVPRPEC